MRHIPTNLTIDTNKIAEFERKADLSLKGYKFAMWEYWVTKLIAVKELTGYTSPELQKWYKFVQMAKKGELNFTKK